MTESGTTPILIGFENIVALLSFAILLVSAVFWADRPPTMEKTDFSVTYIVSRMVYLGQGAKLYDLAEQQKLKRLLLPDAEPLIYEHPPFEALLLAPLGALPYKTAYLTWGLINVAIWLMLPYLLRPYAPAPRDELGYLALWLLFAPLGVALFQGQSSLALLLVYSLAFVALKQGRDFRAGAVFGLGLFKFQHAVVGQVLGRSAISLLVAAISAFLIGWSAWRWRATDDRRRGRNFDLMF